MRWREGLECREGTTPASRWLSWGGPNWRVPFHWGTPSAGESFLCRRQWRPELRPLLSGRRGHQWQSEQFSVKFFLKKNNLDFVLKYLTFKNVCTYSQADLFWLCAEAVAEVFPVVLFHFPTKHLVPENDVDNEQATENKGQRSEDDDEPLLNGVHSLRIHLVFC